MLLRNFENKNGIRVFHDDIDEEHVDYNAQGLDNLFKEEERHFWFIARKEFIFQQMKKYIAKTTKIIEIGAGTGNVSRYLKLKGYTDISVGEIHQKGLKYAQLYGISKCYQFDLLRTPFKNEFDTICLFDVLEHLDDELAIQKLYIMLKENGYIILTVPSHSWLWNRFDAISGHKCRYTKNELIKKLNHAGFDIVSARYFFISIVPLLLLRRILNRDNRTPVMPEEHKLDISINPILNALLLFISRIENRLNNYLPNYFGGSLLIIAKKHDTL